MAVVSVSFLEAGQVEGEQSQTLAVAARAIEFFFKRFTEEPAVVEAGQRIPHSIDVQPLELVILNEDGNKKKTGRGKDVRKGGPEGDWTTEKICEVAAAGKQCIPKLTPFVFAEV